MHNSRVFELTLYAAIALCASACVILHYHRRIRKSDPTPPLSRREELLLELEALRKENALKVWRVTCTTRFWQLSRSIQEVMALDASKPDFCGQLQIMLINNSTKSLLALREARPEPEAIPSAIRDADEEKLEAILRYERNQAPETLLDIPWENLLEDTRTQLNALIQAVEEESPEKCRTALERLHSSLDRYGIRAVFYDEAKSQISEPEADYLVGSSWEIPVLYACHTKPWVRIGEMGAARQQER